MSHDELTRLVADGERTADAENVMRFMIHRIRKLLGPLCEKLGRDVIVTEQGGTAGTRRCRSRWSRSALMGCSGKRDYAGVRHVM